MVRCVSVQLGGTPLSHTVTTMSCLLPGGVSRSSGTPTVRCPVSLMAKNPLSTLYVSWELSPASASVNCSAAMRVSVPDASSILNL